MPFTYNSRTGKTYYLHTGPKRGGGTQHFFSKKSAGTLAGQLPAGFEVYETVNGQVYLRRQQPKLIHDAERECIAKHLTKPQPGHRYKVEIQAKTLTVHESAQDIGEDLSWLGRFSVSRPRKTSKRSTSAWPTSNRSCASCSWMPSADGSRPRDSAFVEASMVGSRLDHPTRSRHLLADS